MEALPYTVINSQNQHKLYCERLEDLVSIKKTRVQLDTIALLRLLIFMLGRRARARFRIRIPSLSSYL